MSQREFNCFEVWNRSSRAVSVSLGLGDVSHQMEAGEASRSWILDELGDGFLLIRAYYITIGFP